MPTKIKAGEYLHARGFRIVRETRDWDGRAYRGSMTGDPKTQWVVYEGDRMRTDAPTFHTLRSATRWCDWCDTAPPKSRIRQSEGEE